METKTLTVCDGVIQPNGFCNKCHHTAQTTSSYCGRLLEVATLLTLSKEETKHEVHDKVKSDEVAMFADEETLLLYDHFFRKGLEASKEESQLTKQKVYLVMTQQLIIVGCFSTEDKARKYAGNYNAIVQELEVY